MTWKQIREMADAGVDVQSHTYSHGFLTRRRHPEDSDAQYLLGQALLNLQVPGEQLDDPGQLRQPEDALPRQVSDVGDAVEGQQVVLA